MVFSDFPEGHGSWSELVWLFDSRSQGRGLPGDLLGDQLLARNFLSSGLSCGLLGSCHLINIIRILLGQRF